MPEGDTVRQTATRLDRALTGRELTRADLRVPRHATADLCGGTVLATVPRGKHLLTRLRVRGEELTLHTHLKMEGSWRVHRAGARWERPGHTARVVLVAGDVEAVGFSLGAVDLLRTADEDRVVGHLGPDLLDPDWGEEHLAQALARLRAAPGRPLRSALLDQSLLAGIGNVYAAEVCFLAGLHPETPVRDVPDLPSVVTSAHRLLVLNADRPRRVTTGDPRSPSWVYGRARQPCRRCGTPVRTGTSGDRPGQERVSYWCPTCQPRV
ncbi:Fpg/Nei family DNA glycosylase [Nocardioides sp. GY 10113]|uniref:DNA-formamidopyrimidine glycosylase family protein n=1 Tax=Nocardioides sp. GY 10113 TaxID=2569761 RepID=UPI0010A88ED2|nr:DNA-formamidopyrimidine glycosylase family protein [Nocardioides sp. GY 10113]TIC79862.1 Fpg/Nei family DNA glycosylase [Nocardioides sp. GY 10113]